MEYNRDPRTVRNPQSRLRKRTPKAEESVEYVGSRKTLTNAVKALDVYSNSKVASEYCAQSTEASRKLTLVGYAIMAGLILSEAYAFLSVEDRDHMIVDTSLGKRLNISLNISFPALTCSQVHLDAMDVAGDYHPYMEQHVKKQRIDKDGNAIADIIIERANVFEVNNGSDPNCGSCFGAETEHIKCCDTCEELLRAYGARGWSASQLKTTAPQCVNSNSKKKAVDTQGDEGCNLAGWLEVNKVGGNFHIALGESTVRDGRFIHQFNPVDAPKFNVSHMIHDLKFGHAYPGMSLPLAGISKTCDPAVGTGLYQYFIKLVPTAFKAHPHAEPVYTTRYSYTQRFRPLRLDDDRRAAHDSGHDHHAHARAHAPTALLPGVFFVYDLSAFMVQVTRHRTTLSHFIVRLCAVVGGVFTSLSALARILRL